MSKVTLFIISIIMIPNFGCKKNISFPCNELIGTWYFIEDDSIYTEIYIDSLELMFFSNEHLYGGPYKYRFKNATIIFNNRQFRIESTNPQEMIWNTDKVSLKLRKIDFYNFNFKEKEEDINPYYLRLNTFLVNKRILTTKDALNRLCNNIELDENNFQCEEMEVVQK